MTAEEIAPLLVANGHEQITMPELDSRLARLGYKRKAGDHCDCLAKHITGPLAGESHPCRTHYVIHKESKLSFAHVDAPKDRLAELQELRRTVFVLRGGKIHEI